MTMSQSPVAVELFSTSILSNHKVRNRHERYVSVLQIKRIPFVYHDLASDEEAKSRWRRRALDPQIPGLLVHDEWRGTFDEFEESIELGELDLFLRIDQDRAKREADEGIIPQPAAAAPSQAAVQTSENDSTQTQTQTQTPPRKPSKHVVKTVAGLAQPRQPSMNALAPALPFAASRPEKRKEDDVEGFMRSIGITDLSLSEEELGEVLEAGRKTVDKRQDSAQNDDQAERGEGKYPDSLGLGRNASRPSIPRTYIPSADAGTKPLRLAKMGNGDSSRVSSSTTPHARYNASQTSSHALAAEAQASISSRSFSSVRLREAISQGDDLKAAMSQTRLASNTDSAEQVVGREDIDELLASLGLNDVKMTDEEAESFLFGGSIPEGLGAGGERLGRSGSIAERARNETAARDVAQRAREKGYGSDASRPTSIEGNMSKGADAKQTDVQDIFTDPVPAPSTDGSKSQVDQANEQGHSSSDTDVTAKSSETVTPSVSDGLVATVAQGDVHKPGADGEEEGLTAVSAKENAKEEQQLDGVESEGQQDSKGDELTPRQMSAVLPEAESSIIVNDAEDDETESLEETGQTGDASVEDVQKLELTGEVNEDDKPTHSADTAVVAGSPMSAGKDLLPSPSTLLEEDGSPFVQQSPSATSNEGRTRPPTLELDSSFSAMATHMQSDNRSSVMSQDANKSIEGDGAGDKLASPSASPSALRRSVASPTGSSVSPPSIDARRSGSEAHSPSPSQARSPLSPSSGSRTFNRRKGIDVQRSLVGSPGSDVALSPPIRAVGTVRNASGKFSSSMSRNTSQHSDMAHSPESVKSPKSPKSGGKKLFSIGRKSKDKKGRRIGSIDDGQSDEEIPTTTDASLIDSRSGVAGQGMPTDRSQKTLSVILREADEALAGLDDDDGLAGNAEGNDDDDVGAFDFDIDLDGDDGIEVER